VGKQSCVMTHRQRSRSTRKKWQRLVSEQGRSGQTVTAFCRERGLCRPYFFVWKKRLRKGVAAKFLEVHVAEGTPGAADDPRIEVRLKNGRSLVVGRGFDADHLRALLAVVEPAR
jgi:transposase-like protein